MKNYIQILRQENKDKTGVKWSAKENIGKWREITAAEARRAMNNGVWRETHVGWVQDRWLIYYKL